MRNHLETTRTTADHSEAYAVRDTVFRLRDAHRDLVMLIHWDGFSVGEAAQILDLNPSTARARYSAARDTLRQALRDVDCLSSG